MLTAFQLSTSCPLALLKHNGNLNLRARPQQGLLHHLLSVAYHDLSWLRGEDTATEEVEEGNVSRCAGGERSNASDFGENK